MIALLTKASDAQAQKDWELKRQKDGIKVWVKEVAGSGMRAFKAETVFNVPVGSCIALLRDIDRFTELFPDCISSKRIAQSDTGQVHYIHLDAPWPVNDRDGVFRFSYSKDGSSCRVKSVIIPGHEPVKNGIVRLSYGVGEWHFKPLDANRTALTYTFHAEPGGSIPEWLADRATIDTPFGVITNFQRMVGGPAYSGKQLPFGLK